MDGNVTGFSPPDKFYFDLQRFDTAEVSTSGELKSAIENASDGDTIKLTDNISLSLTKSMTIDKTINLDLGEYQITTSYTEATWDEFEAGEKDGNAYCVFNIREGGTLNVTADEEDKGGINNANNRRVFYIEGGGNLSINHGTYIAATTYTKTASNQINGLIMLDTVNEYDFYLDEETNKVFGVNKHPGSITLNNVNATVDTYVIRDWCNGWAYSFGESYPSAFVNSGYKINVNGGTYKSTINVGLSEGIFQVSGEEINFTDVDITGSKNPCIYILNGSTATIKGSKTKLTMPNEISETSSYKYGVNVVAVSQGATLNIEGGTYNSNGYSMYVYSSGGNINVTGDATFNHTSDTAFVIKKEFDSENYGKYYAEDEISSNVNISNGTFNIQNAEKLAVKDTSGTTPVKESLVVTGGVFSKDISAFIANDYKENCLYFDEKFYVGDSRDKMTATAYSLYIDDVTYYYSTQDNLTTAINNMVTNHVVAAQIGTNKYYTTFAKAYEAAANGDTIKLLANDGDVGDTTPITISKELTIDLNGHKIQRGGNSKITAIEVKGTSGNLTLIDTSANSKGTVEITTHNETNGGDVVSLTDGASFTLKSGKITSNSNNITGVSVAEGCTFNMTDGKIWVVGTLDDPSSSKGVGVQNSGTVNFNGGTINAREFGIDNKDGTANVNGGVIQANTGVNNNGTLNVLGGKIKGIDLTQEVGEEAGEWNIPEEDGNSIEQKAVGIKMTGGTLNVGKSGKKSDIEISGINSALEISGASTINLYDGKLYALSGVTLDTDNKITAETTNAKGTAISYKNAEAKLNLNGVILGSKITVGTGVNATVGENIVVESVAIASEAVTSMSDDENGSFNKAFKAVLQKENESNLATKNIDGVSFNYAGNAVNTNTIATIGDSIYSSLDKAIDAASETDEKTVTLAQDLTISDQVNVSEDVRLNLGTKTLIFTGTGNAALKVASGKTVTLDSANNFKDSNGNVLGIAMPEGAEVKIGDTAFTKSAKIMTSSTDTLPTYFQNINDAMKQFDQPGEILMASITSSTATNNVPADEPGVVTPADATDESGNLRITLSGSEVELTGLAASKDVTISKDQDNKKNITLNKSNFGRGIIVLGNAGNYKFNLLDDEESSGTLSFTGSDVGEVISNAIANLTLSGEGGADTITNTGASATINGGDGNDSITNTANNASVNGGAGDDSINNSNGGDNSSVYGGAGNDVISNGAKSAYLFGGAGNDLIKNTYAPTDASDTLVVTIDGGDGSDTIISNSTGKELFYYSKGNDSITGYGEGDIISLTGTAVSPFTDISKFSVDSNKFTFNFGTNNTVNVDVSGVSTVSIKSGTDNYYYSANSVAKNTNGVTLTSAYTTQNFSASISGTKNVYTTVDASAVTIPVSIKGVDSKNNYLIASESKGGTLDAGTGTNSLYGGTSGADLFVHTANAKDFIFNYTYGTDTVSVSNAATDLETGINYDGSNFVVSLGASDSLTFNTASAVELKDATNTYYYAADQAMKNGESLTLKSTFSTTTFNLNASKWNGLYAGVSSIDASKVTQSGGLKITGISGNANWIKSASLGGAITGGANGNTLISATDSAASLTLTGGESADSLIGGSGKDLFVYTGGADSINSYTSGTDVVRVNNGFRLAEATVAVGNADEDNGQANISLTFDNANTLVFEGIGSLGAVRVQQGTNNNYYTYAQQYYAHNNSVTLAAGHASLYNGTSSLYSEYQTINAAAVNNAISIMGNSLNNYIFGATAKGGSINGGTGNDKINVSDRSSIASYLFEYTAGKDEVIGFASSDSVDIDPTKITAAKASNSNSKLALTVDKNKNVLTLRSEDEITKVTLKDGADYLTKDGYVEGQGFSLFGSAKGQIDLNDALYTGSNISLVAADSVKSQSVTLTGGTQGGTFIYAPNNKRRDGFVYGGGNVSISGYEAGRDRIDLNEASLTSFEVKGNDEVVLKVGDGTISIESAKDKEVLLHDATRGRAFKKMVFAQTGIIENKAKNPTIATVSGAATNYSVLENGKTTIKKIYVTGLNAAGASIQAGDKNNTQIDARAAGYGVSLSGGAKNDKLIGNTVASANDLFVYNAGKDVIQNYSEGDLISISGGLEDSLGNAKITTGSRSIKFQFTNKNTLTIKSNTGETLSNTLNINGNEKTYAKNAIESGGQVTLTSAYSGTFNTASTKGIDGAVSTVDGAAVSRNLSYKGSTAAESLTGGTKKTMFKGAGGADTLVGGTGKDIFFYAKNDAGTTTIADFEFGANKDKLKIASGTISEISSVTADSKTAIRFAMNSGKNTANVGWFQVTSGKGGTDITASKVAIKANNTFYWFNQDSTAQDSDGNAVGLGQLITSDSRVSASDVSSYSVIDLNYSTNLAKAGVAVKVANAKPTNS